MKCLLTFIFLHSMVYYPYEMPAVLFNTNQYFIFIQSEFFMWGWDEGTCFPHVHLMPGWG